MKFKFGKKVEPIKFKIDQILKLNIYHSKISVQASKYSKLSTTNVSNCYVCDNNSFSKDVLSVYGFDYTQCLNCSHLFVTKRLNKRDENRFYQESKSYSQTYTDSSQLDYRLKKIAQPKVDFIMNQLSIKQGSWLDVGCAVGDIIKCVGNYPNWTGIGIDISKPSINTGKKYYNVDLKRTNIVNFFKNNPNSKFDVISFFGYFCVTANLKKEINIAKKHLNLGGYLVIGESNADSFSTTLQRSYPKLSTRHIIPPNIVQMFTKKSMEKLMENSNLKIIAQWNFGLDFFEFLKYLSLIDKNFNKSQIFDFLSENLNDFQKVIDKKFKGDYFITVTKKTN